MNALPTRRHNWHPASFAAASLVWMICSGLGPVHLAAVAPTAGWRSGSLRLSDNWNTLSLDMTVKRSHVDKNGAPVGMAAPTVQYHVERSNRTGPWKTVVTIIAVDRQSTYTLSGLVRPPTAFPVARLEDDEDGTPVRAYDALGHSLSTPPPSSPVTIDPPLFPTRVTGRTWVTTLLATADNKAVRQLDLERRYGKATKVNGLSRYMKRDAVMSDEVYVDTRVDPVENNLTRNAKRIVHRTFSYAAAYADAFVRTGVRSEVEVAPTSDERAIVDTTFSNIGLERR
jgi:hypothetical protein